MLVRVVRFQFSNIVVALIALLIAPLALADSPQITAVLSSSETSVGQTVQMQIRLTGARGVRPPEEIPVDGLNIHYVGDASESQINLDSSGLHATTTLTYTYTILPEKAGTFTIPPQTIQAGSASLRTPELTLHVSDNGGTSAARQPQSRSRPQNIDDRNVGFLELVVPKRNAYVGEVIPVEIRLGVREQVEFTGEDIPDLNIQGVTIQRSQKVERRLERIGGIAYRTITVKAAISAIHAGTLELPPLQMRGTVLIPTAPDIHDPFGEDFFRDPFRMLQGKPRNVVLNSQSVKLDIKPLPPNPPTNFSGAVGMFTFEVEAKPKTVQVSDPITVTATVTGRGNFSAMNAPALEDLRGWHTYPPSSKFVQNDDVGISGTKTFDMVMSPDEKKTTIPPLGFSYFDPLKEKYVSLRSEAIPIQVEGGSLATTQPATSPPSAQTPPRPSAVTSGKPEDILYQLTDRGRIESFTPIYAQRAFWLAQLAPLAGLALLSGWQIRQRKLGNREAVRMAALEQESAEVLRQLRRKDLSPSEYFGRAARAIRLKTALAKNVDPNTVDADFAAAAFALDSESSQQLRRVFERSDELRFGGAGNGSETVSKENRHEVLDLIERLRV